MVFNGVGFTEYETYSICALIFDFLRKSLKKN